MGIRNRLLAWAGKAADWEERSMQGIIEDETRDIQNVLILSRLTSNKRFERFESMSATDKLELLHTEFGWEFPMEVIEVWRITAINYVGEAGFGHKMFGYISFKTKADLMVWKLTYQYKD